MERVKNEKADCRYVRGACLLYFIQEAAEEFVPSYGGGDSWLRVSLPANPAGVWLNGQRQKSMLEILFWKIITQRRDREM